MSGTSEHPDVVRAVEATGRRQLNCSGAWTTLVQQAAMLRMMQEGVRTSAWVAAAAEAQRDWRLPMGQGLAKIMGERLPFHRMLAANLKAAKGG